ncbi:hypothetical protein M408DRAFT_10333 [Serendipita vermifera MAFF 305830]|uniref:Uncharacterized protein n=1 Tax=Serendipita vermifera MAFF 305830 TaxID=933852 RepID=A0A0C3B0I6_SERVB|nr:hypothetical protein M408DRAFT_10333 [Serendipita vermifera MAFF 305830]
MQFTRFEILRVAGFELLKVAGFQPFQVGLSCIKWCYRDWVVLVKSVMIIFMMAILDFNLAWSVRCQNHLAGGSNEGKIHDSYKAHAREEDLKQGFSVFYRIARSRVSIQLQK